MASLLGSYLTSLPLILMFGIVFGSFGSGTSLTFADPSERTQPFEKTPPPWILMSPVPWNDTPICPVQLAGLRATIALPYSRGPPGSTWVTASTSLCKAPGDIIWRKLLGVVAEISTVTLIYA